MQLILLPLQADVHDTHVSRAINPINCLTTLTSIAYLRWASKSLLPQVPGAPLDVAIAQVSCCLIRQPRAFREAPARKAALGWRPAHAAHPR